MKAYEIIAAASFNGLSGYGEEADEIIKSGVVAGIKYMEENPELNPVAVIQEGSVMIYPPATIENEDMERLQNVISPYLDGCSGSMFYSAVSIALFWKIHGTDEFLTKLRVSTGR